MEAGSLEEACCREAGGGDGGLWWDLEEGCFRHVERGSERGA